MNDRGIIKWQPFESVISSSVIAREIREEKSKIQKPILSEEQKIIIENNILEAFYENVPISILYFKDNHLYKKKNKIIKIYPTNKKIIFDDYSYLYFNQIVNTTI